MKTLIWAIKEAADKNIEINSIFSCVCLKILKIPICEAVLLL